MNMKLNLCCVRPKLPLILLNMNAKIGKRNVRRLVENMVIKTDIKIIMMLTEDVMKNYLFKIYGNFFRVFTSDLK